MIRQLDGLAIGSAQWRDCGLVAVLDGPDVLNRLVDSDVNIEELDYLAKRLDSFTASELSEDLSALSTEKQTHFRTN